MARRRADRLLTSTGLTRSNRSAFRALKHPEWLYRRRDLLPPLTFSPATNPAPDLPLCERLKTAHALATSEGAGGTSGMWDRITEQHHGSLVSCLTDPNPLALAQALSSMFTSDFMWGISSGSGYKEGSSRLGSLIWSARCLEHLLSLAEAVGAVRAECPEQGVRDYALKEGTEALVANLQASLRISIGFPNVGAPYGLQIGDALITAESPEHIYAAMRADQAMCLAGISPMPSVVEIGAGFGGTAFRLLQMRKVSRYTIIDLPIVNVLQGYFLSKVLGEAEVSFYGEPAAKIAVLPTHALHSIGDVDVALNENSMPEMPESVVDGYLSWAKQHVRGLFFSYNQEAYSPVNGVPQVLLPAAVARVGGFDLLTRSHSWLRRGYVEEVYVPWSRAPRDISRQAVRRGVSRQTIRHGRPSEFAL